jgi:spore germination protein GerM
VATRRSNRRTQSKGSQAIVVFWLIFIVVIVCVFMVNAETIQRNFNLFRTRLTTSPGAEEEMLLMMEEEPVVTVIIEHPVPEPVTEPAVQPQTPPPAQPQVQPPAQTPQAQTQQPQTPPPAQPQAQTPAQTQQTQTPPPAQPQAQTPAQTQQTQTQPQTQTPPPVQTRDRAVFFTQVDRDGQILHSRVVRRLPVSESPMTDVLNTLLAGPSADELGRGIVNLIPQNTRIISATVRGNTAYINFSEDFLFNTFGVEGYVAQLRQIVWTVTEFQNVRDVQILIEGRRMDYLGEGIWIGSPISRQSF